MPKTLCLILGDQLTTAISSLKAIDKTKDVVLLAEVWDETQYVKHHQQKIAFLFSAMRHFAEQLRERGYQVAYYALDGGHRYQSFSTAVKHAVNTHKPDNIVVTEPGEYRVLKAMQQWQADLGIDVDILEDDRFYCSIQDFKTWAKGRKQLRMEGFYREMRKRHAVLLTESGTPEGGKWNYDADNRKPPVKGLAVPKPYQAKLDDTTKAVIKLVAETFSDHFGDLTEFHYAVTRQQALTALNKFIDERLVDFGSYQDAMVTDEPWMFHAHIGLYLNCGLLLPDECVAKAELAYREGRAPLNAVEGFIRQILGWREYIRGIYWLKMPDYEHENFFDASRPLPSFYWDADTDMQCLKQCVQQTQTHAYAHHIQRLMVLGNFALLAGIDPQFVNKWFLIVYADAYQWVELPNVTGMALFADGGVIASKPYAASGAYINRMSNYCKSCHYQVKLKTGSEACPFNYLYWYFLKTNADKLSRNPRLAIAYKNLNNMDDDKLSEIMNSAEAFLNNMNEA
ncbi:MAG: cryptochrome/photolyase family protein [Legionellales bacterium]|nr:cryptochrome/photolyase family protein [Legionellales bacterium]|tara:strand:- start:425 stop:1960 length:1536 start_codon:yes stop_codon:yes gene_type:complete